MSRQIIEKICPVCEKPFTRPYISNTIRDQLCCSQSCAGFLRWQDEETRQKIKESHSGENNWRWLPVGTRKKSYSSDRNGVKKWYWKVKCEDGRWRWEHRVVAETILGRPLTRSEHVHHKDDDGLNNGPDNLEVLSGADHARLTLSANLHECPLCGQLHNGKIRPID